MFDYPEIDESKMGPSIVIGDVVETVAESEERRADMAAEQQTTEQQISIKMSDTSNNANNQTRPNRQEKIRERELEKESREVEKERPIIINTPLPSPKPTHREVPKVKQQFDTEKPKIRQVQSEPSSDNLLVPLPGE